LWDSFFKLYTTSINTGYEYFFRGMVITYAGLFLFSLHETKKPIYDLSGDILIANNVKKQETAYIC